MGNVIYLGKFLITKEISLFLTSNLKHVPLNKNKAPGKALAALSGTIIA